MIRAWEPVYERAEGGAGEDALDAFIRGNFKMLWRYRFFYRENVALMQADPDLADRQVEVNRARLRTPAAPSSVSAARQGLLTFPDPDVRLEDVLTITWKIASHYLQHNGMRWAGRWMSRASNRRAAAEESHPPLPEKMSLMESNKMNKKNLPPYQPPRFLKLAGLPPRPPPAPACWTRTRHGRITPKTRIQSYKERK